MDRYGAKELAKNAIINVQVWHRAVKNCDVCAVGKVQQLAHPKTSNHKVNRPFQLCYVEPMKPFTQVAIGGYKYVSKDGEYIGEKFRGYCLETATIQAFVATKTQQKIDVSERVGGNLCAMVWCMLADSDFPSSMWGDLFMVTTNLKNRTPYKVLKMETP